MKPVLDALGPVAVALPPALALLRWSLPERPPGDLLLLFQGLRTFSIPMPDLSSRWAGRRRLFDALALAIARAERGLLRWSLSGPLLSVLVLAILALLA